MVSTDENLREDYINVWIILVYTAIFLPGLGFMSGFGVPVMHSLYFLIPILAIYLGLAFWIAFRMRFPTWIKVLWLGMIIYLLLEIFLYSYLGFGTFFFQLLTNPLGGIL